MKSHPADFPDFSGQTSDLRNYSFGGGFEIQLFVKSSKKALRKCGTKIPAHGKVWEQILANEEV